MLISFAKTWLRRARAARFARDKRGVAAIELSLVAVPFFLTLTAMGEVAVMALAQSNLDFAMSETGRRIRTGEIQQAGLTQADVRDEVCARVNRFMALDCDGNLWLQIDQFDDFTELDLSDPSGGEEFEDVEWPYDPGGPSQIVLARGFYEWQVFTPFFQNVFGNTEGGKRLIVSSVIFRNEPFPPPGDDDDDDDDGEV